MEFVSMILHLVISCDPCIGRQIHTYLIIACISDISVKSDLKFYFMGICKDITVIFAICIFFKVDRKESNTVTWLFTEYDVARGILKFQCKTWEVHATSYSVKPLYYLYPINKHIWKCSDVFGLYDQSSWTTNILYLTNKETDLYVNCNISLFYSDRTLIILYLCKILLIM